MNGLKLRRPFSKFFCGRFPVRLSKLIGVNMQIKECSCARFEAVKERDMKSRNGELRGGRVRTVWRISRFLYLGLTTLGVFSLILLPVHGRASEEMERRSGDRDEARDRGREQKEIEVLESKIAALEATISSLQGKVTTLESHLAAVQSNPALALGPFVSVDPSPQIGVIGPNITFSGANIHIVSGSQATDDHGNSTGLGNLIIGYDEDPGLPVTGDSNFFGIALMQLPGYPSPLLTGDRGGSHNLVIGAGNRFTRSASGGLVVGERNTISALAATVSGGFVNSAGGVFSSISAGVRNNAGGTFSSVSGGGLNFAGDFGDSVSGGVFNQAYGRYSDVSGGNSNAATNFFGSVTGGVQNYASGDSSTVIGGQLNSPTGFASVILGGQNVSNSIDFSIAPKVFP